MLSKVSSFFRGPAKITTPAVTDPKVQNVDRYKLRAKTEAEEELFDLAAARHVPRPSGIIASSAQLVKGALGAGILSGHVSYMYAGVGVALVSHFIMAIYMTYCFYLLSYSARVLCKRTRMPHLNYSDLGEAAMLCTEKPTWVWMSRRFRHFIDIAICMDLFGSCMCYQLICAKSLKQLVENTLETSLDPIAPGYPSLRMYLAMFMIPFILICLIKHLKWLAPFSMAANTVVILCIGCTVYYAMQKNPNFEGLILAKGLEGFLRFAGVTVFSMSCSGVVLAVENNMKNPDQFPISLFSGMFIIAVSTMLTSFFGYVGYLENCEAPITINFPMETGPKILKSSMVVMIYITHALNFWVPFNNVFYYVKLRYPEEKHNKLEYILRGVISAILTLLAIAVPKLADLIAIIGTFCLSLMSFMWPNFIYLLVIESRPGYGRCKWRLLKGIFLICIGLFLWTAGTYVNLMHLIKMFFENEGS